MEHIPVLKVGDYLLVTIQDELDDRLVMNLQEDLLMRVNQTGALGVLIDISGLEIVDSFTGRVLVNTARMARLLDADTVVVGMRPAIAITLVELGLNLSGVATALNVDKGIDLLRAMVEQRETGSNDGSDRHEA